MTFWTRRPDYPKLTEPDPPECLLGRWVADPYRWMEDERHPALSGWLAAQTELTERLLRGHDRDRWRTLFDSLTPNGQTLPSVRVGSRCYRLESDGGPHPVLTMAHQGRQSTLYDPNAGATGGQPRRIARWTPDPFGRLVAVEVHEGGDESGQVLLVDAVTGAPVSTLWPAASHAAVAWSADRICYVAGKRGHQRLACRTVPDGTDAFLDIPVTAPNRLEVLASPDGRWLLLLTRATLGDAPTLWVASWEAGEPSWRRVLFGPTRALAWTFGFDDDLYVADDSGSLLRFDLIERELLAKKLVAGGAGVIDGVCALRGGALVGVRRAGFERLVQVLRPGAKEPVTLARWFGRLRLGQVSAPEGNAVQVTVEDPVHGFWHAWVDEKTERLPVPHGTRLRLELATSHDGQRVPVTICDPETDPGGPLPMVLLVYGGFGLDTDPAYEPALAAWLRSGGRVGWIHARGGSELGRWWAEAGRGPGKVRTVEDVCAAVGHLVETGQTTERQVAIIGASNGGLVVAAAVALRPEQFAAAVCVNPLTDMVRYPSAGLGALWLTEYGDPAEPGELDTLLSYSPYHRVAAGRRYPAVLLAAGTNDSRVPPWHAWKLCAMLQSSTSSARPVLLDTDFASGHNGRDRDRAALLAASTLTLLGRATGLAPEKTSVRVSVA
jgi:prolyl oligopeptidase